jgi:hypothetical protein
MRSNFSNDIHWHNEKISIFPSLTNRSNLNKKTTTFLIFFFLHFPFLFFLPIYPNILLGKFKSKPIKIPRERQRFSWAKILFNIQGICSLDDLRKTIFRFFVHKYYVCMWEVKRHGIKIFSIFLLLDSKNGLSFNRTRVR